MRTSICTPINNSYGEIDLPFNRKEDNKKEAVPKEKDFYSLPFREGVGDNRVFINIG